MPFQKYQRNSVWCRPTIPATGKAAVGVPGPRSIYASGLRASQGKSVRLSQNKEQELSSGQSVCEARGSSPTAEEITKEQPHEMPAISTPLTTPDDRAKGTAQWQNTQATQAKDWGSIPRAPSPSQS